METGGGSSLGLLPLSTIHQPLDLSPSFKLDLKGFSSSSLKDGNNLLSLSSNLSSDILGKLQQLSTQPQKGGRKTGGLKAKSLQSPLKLSNQYLQGISILSGSQCVKDNEKEEPPVKIKRETSSLLKNWHVVLDLDPRQVDFKKRQEIKNDILYNGGVLGFSVTKRTTHLLVSHVNKKTYSFKRQSAQKYSVPVLDVDYLYDCLNNGRILETSSYFAADRGTVEEKPENVLLSGKIKRKPRAELEERPDTEKSKGSLIDLKFLQWTQFNTKLDYQIAKSCYYKNNSGDEGFQLELHVLSESNSTRFRIYRQFVDKEGPKFEYCCVVSTTADALNIYSKVSNKILRETSVSEIPSWEVGSHKFRKMYLESFSGARAQCVSNLVDVIWVEAIGSASSMVDMDALTKAKLHKAEVTLAKVKALLMDGTTAASRDLLITKSREFHQQICYKCNQDVIDTRRKLNKMQELCVLLADVLNVQEATNWKRDCHSKSKYRSLRCHITEVARSNSQYGDVMTTIGSEALKKCRARILNVFSVTRPFEDSSFSHEGKKTLRLFHATRATSLLGILSRGLLLPKNVEVDVGIERRDFGFLGQGIYFADDIGSNIRFTEPSSHTKTRFMLICDVAVGKQYQTWQHQPHFTDPPRGYDSVLGMKETGENPSAFKHNEYSVYDVGLQRLSYLIEFAQAGETPLTYNPSVDSRMAAFAVDQLDEGPTSQDLDVTDVMGVTDPLDKVTPGLQTDSGEPILLERVSVKANMMDLIAQVTVFQRYRNCNKTPIEAKYVFPLDDTAAVCGFEAFIGNKHIVGKVKEKEVAHREYREAVSKGHGAYLMDEEAADVFTVSVGNLPPSTEVIIKITYIIELSLDGDRIVFNLPGSLASWRKKGALAEETQDVTSTLTTGDEDEIKFELSLSVAMPFDIESISCPSHDLKIKRTAAKACITLADGENRLREGFQLLVKLNKIHLPHMWVEQNPEDNDSQACMLTFYPEFEVSRVKNPEVSVILDCSNSMKGDSFEHAKKICFMILALMPSDFRVNIVKFGSTFSEFYPSSKARGKLNLDDVKDFLRKSAPCEGNTDVWRPLYSHYLLQNPEEFGNVFIITDGHIDHEAQTLKNIADNSGTSRIFTFGVGSDSNKHMLKAMARSGNGAFEFFDGKTKSTWTKKVGNQLKKASQPSVSSLSIRWHQYDHNAKPARQAPRILGALFNGSRLVVYGFVQHCLTATLKAVIDGQELSTIVSTSKLSITKGLILHRLTARALIRDWEDGMLDTDRIKEQLSREDEKASIIELSKRFGIITSLTSFVAVEEREKNEVQEQQNMEGKLTELLKQEDVDILPYMDWQITQEKTLDGQWVDMERLSASREQEDDEDSSDSDGSDWSFLEDMLDELNASTNLSSPSIKSESDDDESEESEYVNMQGLKSYEKWSKKMMSRKRFMNYPRPLLMKKEWSKKLRSRGFKFIPPLLKKKSASREQEDDEESSDSDGSDWSYLGDMLDDRNASTNLSSPSIKSESDDDESEESEYVNMQGLKSYEEWSKKLRSRGFKFIPPLLKKKGRKMDHTEIVEEDDESETEYELLPVVNEKGMVEEDEPYEVYNVSRPVVTEKEIVEEDDESETEYELLPVVNEKEMVEEDDESETIYELPPAPAYEKGTMDFANSATSQPVPLPQQTDVVPQAVGGVRPPLPMCLSTRPCPAQRRVSKFWGRRKFQEKLSEGPGTARAREEEAGFETLKMADAKKKRAVGYSSGSSIKIDQDKVLGQRPGETHSNSAEVLQKMDSMLLPMSFTGSSANILGQEDLTTTEEEEDYLGLCEADLYLPPVMYKMSAKRFRQKPMAEAKQMAKPIPVSRRKTPSKVITDEPEEKIVRMKKKFGINIFSLASEKLTPEPLGGIPWPAACNFLPQGPLTFLSIGTSATADEPCEVDLRFELYKIPQLRETPSDLTSRAQLAKTLCLQGYIDYLPCLNLVNISRAKFEAFFRFVGIFSLGEEAARAFLNFFATWLAYVVVTKETVGALPDLTHCEAWLDTQGNKYRVSDYQLGHSTWSEVAMAMLGAKNVSKLTMM
ncbi:protein mono-ADP-ribosyltransferase PARP4-like isoform X4 [Apostichopus japonicus]|uniref:protein mono-ADP-ribosyltransferase PARP4-like isoform X4 n=1 Tax=Stichopus japonicus TaxID=307972 RepID=UPI003AB35C2F